MIVDLALAFSSLSMLFWVAVIVIAVKIGKKTQRLRSAMAYTALARMSESPMYPPPDPKANV